MLSRTRVFANRSLILSARHALVSQPPRLPFPQHLTTGNPVIPVFQSRQMSFFGNLMDNVKNSMSRDKELNEKLANLEKQAKQFEESEAVKKAKDSLGKAKTDAEKASEGLSKKITDVFQSVSASDFAKKTKEELEQFAKEGKKFTENVSQKSKEYGEKAEKTFESTTESNPYLKKFTSTIKDASDDMIEGSMKQARMYGGFRNAEERRIEKERRQKLYNDVMQVKAASEPAMQENPDAGSGVVLHKDSAWKQSWDNFRDNNPFMQRVFSLKRDYDDSDSPLVHYLHRFQDSIVGIFSENEHAQVIKEIKMIDPAFNLDNFTKEMHNFIIPEVLESFLHGNHKDLKEWCSEGAYSVLNATMEEREKSGLHVDSKILELKNVDLAMAKMLEDNPVLLFTFNTQQITVMRDRTGKIVEGSEDDVERVHYVIAVMKQKESNPITDGWKVVEIGIQATMKTW